MVDPVVGGERRGTEVGDFWGRSPGSGAIAGTGFVLAGAVLVSQVSQIQFHFRALDGDHDARVLGASGE